ncbi:N-6 DNA methylase [Limnothrix sp. FACHB-1083]|uniref:N-6 DNA methylase n=1 Tax=unclassified Limnothrix TaxID=2632864 RepID=UPI0016812B2D|nr:MULTISPECIES: N-6 DNA methylase [unclassified Limnothrix]MBD2161592.1 N-6 DNA methylase [Limnothrix sp. FACHB-1083]MBD2192305.1 N-6 DNA methylase [Limnothrix sp. FACHB-1088]
MNESNRFSGEIPTPESLTKLITALCHEIPAGKILDPACGNAKLLIAAAGNKETIVIHGVEIDPNAYLQSEEALKSSGKKYKLWNQDFFTTELRNDFDLVVCHPPFISHFSQEFEGLKWRNFSGFLIKSLQILNQGGYAIFIISDSFLFSERERKNRNLLSERYSLSAVISLPLDTFVPFCRIKTSIVIFRKSQQAAKIFFAKYSESKGIENIIRDFHYGLEHKNSLQNFWIDFEKIQESDSVWQYEHYRNLREFETRKTNSKYPVFLLGDLILEEENQSIEDNFLLIQKIAYSPKVLLKSEITDAEKFRNYIEINVDNKKILPQYLKLYLNSEQGKKQLSAVSRQGITSLFQLESIKNVQIEVPEIPIQFQIIETGQKLTEVSVTVQSLESRFYKDLFDYSKLYSLVEKFHQLDREDISFGDLIYPLATTFRIARKGSPNLSSQMNSYFKMFEMVAELNSIVLLSALPEDIRRERHNDIWGQDNYKKTSFGVWVGLYRRLTNIYNSLARNQQKQEISVLDNLPFGKDYYLKLSSKKIVENLSQITEIRNKSEHGGSISEIAIQEALNKMHSPLMEVFKELSNAYSALDLIYPQWMKKTHGQYTINFKRLQGTHYPYSEEIITTEFDVNTESLYLFNLISKERLELISDFIKLIQCPKCGHWSIYFYSKTNSSKTKADYINFDNEIHDYNCPTGDFLKKLLD